MTGTGSAIEGYNLQEFADKYELKLKLHNGEKVVRGTEGSYISSIKRNWLVAMIYYRKGERQVSMDGLESTSCVKQIFHNDPFWYGCWYFPTPEISAKLKQSSRLAAYH